MATIREHLQQAQQLARGGRIADAIELCRRVRGAAPDAHAAGALEAALLITAKRPADALALLDELTGEHDLPDLWVNKAVALRELKRPAEARKACARAVAIDARHRAANLNLAAMLVDEGAFHDAVDRYWVLLESEPDSVPARGGLAAALLCAGDARAALDQARIAVERDPKAPGPRITMAAAHARLGEFQAAERSARTAIARASNNAEARAVLAEVLVVTGRGGEAIPHLEAMVAHGTPEQKERARLVASAVRSVVREVMGDVPARKAAMQLLNENQFAAARDAFRRVVEANGADYHARFGLGLAHAALEEFAEALVHIDAAITNQPILPRFHYERARVLFNLGRRGDALAACQTALMLDPRDHGVLNLGARILIDSGHEADALPVLRTLLLHHDHDIVARVLLLNVLIEEEMFEAAEEQITHVEKHNPEHPAIPTARARIHERRGELEEALSQYEAALRYDAVHDDALLWRASVLLKLRRTNEARIAFERALKAAPHSPRAHFNRGVFNLILGDFRKGWEGYAHREKVRDARPIPMPTPRWKGEPLDGRTLLIHREQGLGDTLMFSRLIPALGRLDGRVLFQPHNSLAHFFRDFEGVDEVLEGLNDEQLASVPHDFHVPLLDLAIIMQLERDSVPARVPYIRADPARVEKWSAHLSAKPGLRVGIAWQGNPRFFSDHQRSLRLELFEELSRVADVRLIALQKGPGREQLAEIADRFDVEDLAAQLDNDGDAFADTAAVMQHLDVLIASDSAIVHLAGALGVRCWTLLAHTPEWRWGIEGDETPWYPTMKLYRQQSPGDWKGVMQRVAEDLARLSQ